MKLIIAIFTILFSAAALFAQDDFADAVSESFLTGVGLPRGAYLVREQNVPANIRQLLTNFIESNASFKQGKTESLVLTDNGAKKSNVAKLRGQVESSLRNSGWTYEISGQEKDITFFTAVKKTPARQNVFGFWVPADGNLMLVMTEVLVSAQSSEPARITQTANSVQPDRKSPQDAQTFNLSATDENVNVMGDKMPPMPSFPALTKKAGKIRGYVKDTNGNFLRGAAISLGSIRIGYSRLVTETVTDSKGYYELDLPLNSNKFHYAAYAVDYGAGKAAMALHPADGSLEDNAPGEGGIENFVLLPYGIADRALLAENSNYGASFYGGSIALYINVAYPDADESLNKGRFFPGSVIEITLTPDGALIDGSSSKTFVIRKKIDENTRNEFFINNIPVAKYKLSVTASGKSVSLRQRLPENSVYGIHPTQAQGEADILFYPSSGKPSEIGAGRGGWQHVEIYLERASR